MASVDGLDYVVLRPALVYGPGDTTSVTPRLVCGAVYSHLGEKMKFLWDGKICLNTVHVLDMVRAIVHAATKLPSGDTFNVCDKGATTAGVLNTLVGGIFGIKTGFVNAVENAAAKVNLSMVTNVVNDKHLKPWAELCKKEGILDTPLTPFLDKEALGNNHLSVNGSAIEATGFKYIVPQITEARLRQVVSQYIEMGVFPKSVVA